MYNFILHLFRIYIDITKQILFNYINNPNLFLLVVFPSPKPFNFHATYMFMNDYFIYKF